ncbi:MAG TPA: hypothetical protein VFB82_22530 [Blastocatellia bacterium]|jgi:hypothetical protein|nr:hypothetical protein [Blastocatellia bacterium]
MTGEEMERAIHFLIEHHANVTAGIEGLKEAQQRTAANLDSLTGIVVDLTQNVSRLEGQAEVNRDETRDGFNKLILSNEITRDLAQRVARVAIDTAQRVTTIEDRLR